MVKFLLLLWPSGDGSAVIFTARPRAGSRYAANGTSELTMPCERQSVSFNVCVRACQGSLILFQPICLLTKLHCLLNPRLASVGEGCQSRIKFLHINALDQVGLLQALASLMQSRVELSYNLLGQRHGTSGRSAKPSATTNSNSAARPVCSRTGNSFINLPLTRPCCRIARIIRSM